MIKGLMQHRLIRLIGLIAVTPLFIGHGVGCLPWLQHCDESETHSQTYVISGSADYNSFINVGYNISVSAGNLNYTSPARATGVSVAPIYYGISYQSNDTAHRIYATINDAFPGGSAIGEIWVHTFNGPRIKLIHPAARASFLNASFAIDEHEFSLPQSSTMAGTSSYTLSGGSTGTEALNLLAPVTIYLNNQAIHTRNVTDNNVTPAIVFSAAPGDELRILAGGIFPSVLLSSIWLHTPNGNGIKLAHGAMNRSTGSAGVFLDVLYVLE